MSFLGVKKQMDWWIGEDRESMPSRLVASATSLDVVPHSVPYVQKHRHPQSPFFIILDHLPDSSSSPHQTTSYVPASVLALSFSKIAVLELSKGEAYRRPEAVERLHIPGAYGTSCTVRLSVLN